MRAIARACHPSKKVGAILTHCRYLAIASGSSPIARSPLASSKSSSTSGGIFSKRFLFDQLSLPWNTILSRASLACRTPVQERWSPCFLQSGFQPFTNNDRLIPAILLSVFRFFVFLVFCLVDRPFLYQVDDQAAILVFQK